ncbi:MAG: alpha-amylase family glycosyl hydrolase [Bacteroidales bacterium]
MNIRQTLTLLLLFLYSFLGIAQVTTSPAFIQQDYSGETIIYFDATQGNKGMVGATSCYAHTGVITNESKNDSDWKHAPEWKDNSAKYKLEKTGTDTWKLVIPNLRTYYELNENEVIKKLAFVFRDATASKEGKGEGDQDIFVTLHEPGLQVAFTKPTGNYALTIGSSLDISFMASAPADLTLRINDNVVKQLTGVQTLSYTHTFNSAGDFRLKATASLNGTTSEAEILVAVVENVVNEPRPAGLADGIHYSDDQTSATLILHAPGKLSVFAIGEFSDWAQQNKYQMKRDGDYWWVTIDGLTPGAEYGFQYLVNSIGSSAIRIADPYSEKILHELDSYIPASTYPDLKPYPSGKTTGPVSVLQPGKTAYNWEINNYKVQNKASLSVYELLVRDFTDTSDLNGVMQKLDYLQRLGVTAIELMPCQEFSGNDSWGYNPIFYFAMDKAYGTSDMYKKLIDECHKRGMAVILDVVYNQADQDMPFVKLYFDGTKPSADNPWFNVTAPHPYSVFYDFNHESPYTRAFVKRNLQYLLTEYKFDGFRFDLTKGFTNNQSSESTASNYDQSRIDILKDYNNAIREVNPDAVVILEHFCSVPEESALAKEGMMLWRNANGTFGEIMKGYNGNASYLYADGSSMPKNSLIGFIESHDEERLMVYAKNQGLFTTSLSKRLLRTKLSALFSMLIPGPKMIWQFGEMGYDVSINYNGRTGRKPTHWEYLDVATRNEVHDLYTILLSLRREYPELFDGTGSFSWTNASTLSGGAQLAITHPSLSLVAIANFSQSTTTVAPQFPKSGTWYELITEQPVSISESAQNTPISVEANGFRLYADRQPNYGTGITTPEETSRFEIYPNPTTDIVLFRSGNAELVQVISAQGQILQTMQNVSSVDMSRFATGNYWLSVITEGKRHTVPVLKR